MEKYIQEKKIKLKRFILPQSLEGRHTILKIIMMSFLGYLVETNCVII